MKAKTSIFSAFAFGAILASLPYTLSNVHTQAQQAGPAQGGQAAPGQGIPRQGGGFGGGGFQGQPGAPGQGMRFGGQMVNSMTTSGNYLFAAAGDTIYKIKIDTMKIEGQTNLPMPQMQPGIGGGGFGGGGGARGGQGGGFGGGGGQAPAAGDGTTKTSEK